MRVEEALRAGSSRLEDAEVPDASWSAESLLRFVLGWDRAQLLASPDQTLPEDQEIRFRALLEERARRRPLQHLLGMQAFWHHEFQVSPDVLIPRPETEILVEAALARLEGVPSPLVADVGTGSGCIALSLAGSRPDAQIFAIDVSAAALVVARKNAHLLGLADRVAFHEGDLLAPLHYVRGQLDLVASNPPYVSPDEIETLAPEVRDHEPRVALVPAGDRFSVYRRLVPEAALALRGGGLLLLEIGAGMQAGVVDILEGAGFEVEAVLPDLQAIPRTVVARYPIDRPPH
jgi:release factor glutamine methyltransferase